MEGADERDRHAGLDAREFKRVLVVDEAILRAFKNGAERALKAATASERRQGSSGHGSRIERTLAPLRAPGGGFRTSRGGGPASQRGVRPCRRFRRRAHGGEMDSDHGVLDAEALQRGSVQDAQLGQGFPRMLRSCPPILPNSGDGCEDTPGRPVQ